MNFATVNPFAVPTPVIGGPRSGITAQNWIGTIPSGSPPPVTPVLSTTGPGQLAWVWTGANPLFWNVLASPNGSTGWTVLNPIHEGDGYDANDRTGTIGVLWPGGQFYLIVGVDGVGAEVTPRSNILTPPILSGDALDIVWAWAGPDPGQWVIQQFDDELVVWNEIGFVGGDNRDKDAGNDPTINHGVTIRVCGRTAGNQMTVFSNSLVIP